MEAFKQRYPTVSLVIKTGHTDLIVEDIRSGALDLAVASLPLPNEGREFFIQPLYREELVAVVGPGHALAKRRLVQPEEVKKYPLIVFPRGSSTRQVLDRSFQELNITPRIQLELENDEAVEKAIRPAGDAVVNGTGRLESSVAFPQPYAERRAVGRRSGDEIDLHQTGLLESCEMAGQVALGQPRRALKEDEVSGLHS